MPSKYRVESESYPSGNGCYAGQNLDDDYIDSCTTTKIIGEYATLRAAKKAAIEERDRLCEFQDWAEEYYGNANPPYFSCDGDNYDDDETVHIYIVDIAKENSKKVKEAADKENAIQIARNSNAPSKKKKTPGTRKFGPQKGNFKPDLNIFLRNPCPIPGGKARLPSDYGCQSSNGKASFAYSIQRLSDRNYTMRGLCLENVGARYTSFSRPGVIRRCIAWLPDSNLNHHASNETIVDTCHLDLYDHKTGKHLLTAENLLAAVTSETECLFLTNFTGSPQVIVQAIQTCSSKLKCITLNSCTMSTEILQALAKCLNLQGILLADTDQTGFGENSGRALDGGLSQVLSSCQFLKWIYVEMYPFYDACWDALAAGACPGLELLWIDCPKNTNDRIGCTVGDHATIRRVLTERTDLKLCMINPDKKLKSSFVLGNKRDGLKGKKMPNFDEMYANLEEMYDGEW